MAPKTMRAVLIKDGKGPSSSLYLGEAPVPTLAPGQVLVRVHAFGLNRMDILQREGNYPVPPHASKILGVEFSGLIEEIADPPQGNDGDDSALRDALKKWKTGDPVYGLAYGGAYAEYIAVQATHILPKPEHLTFVQAASIPETWLTAYQALVLLAHLKKDEHVLIHAAASGVGIAAIQIARLLGASTVSATASSKSKLDFVQHTLPLGATQGINYKEEEFAPAVQKHTGGHGADVVIDFVGRTHWPGNIDSLAQDGRMVILAFLSGTVVDKVDLAPILRKRLQIIGSTLRARSVAYQAELIRGFNKDVGGKITGEEGEGEVRTYIHKVFKWEQIKEAHDEMEGNATSGKIIVEVS